MVRKAALIAIMMASAAPAAEPAFTYSPFHIETTADPIDDSQEMFAFTGDKDHFISVGCSNKNDGKLMVIMKFPGFIGYDYPGLLMGGTTIQFRFNDSPAKESRWNSKDSRAWTGPDVKSDEFVNGLTGANKVYVRAISRAGDVTGMGFEFPTPTDLLTKVISYCGAKVKS